MKEVFNTRNRCHRLPVLVASCLLLAACGDIEDDPGNALLALTPSGLGDEPGIGPNGLGTAPTNPNALDAKATLGNGLGGQPSVHPKGLGQEAKSGPNGLGIGVNLIDHEVHGAGFGGGAVDWRKLLCDKLVKLGCIDEEESVFEECLVVLYLLAEKVDLFEPWFDCVMEGWRCDDFGLCTHQYSRHDEGTGEEIGDWRGGVCHKAIDLGCLHPLVFAECKDEVENAPSQFEPFDVWVGCIMNAGSCDDLVFCGDQYQVVGIGVLIYEDWTDQQEY